MRLVCKGNKRLYWNAQDIMEDLKEYSWTQYADEPACATLVFYETMTPWEIGTKGLLVLERNDEEIMKNYMFVTSIKCDDNGDMIFTLEETRS